MYNIKSGGYMKLIVGLGNPGKTYEKTRHNIGFMVIDKLLNHLSINLDQNKFNAVFVKTKINNEDVIIMKPQTFMNLSGEAVSQIANFYRISTDDIVIVYDDFDLPLGKIRLREKGSGGTHNGMKNIIQLLGTNNINRIRIGIDKNNLIDQKDYVLGKFNKDEISLLDKAIERVVSALIDYPKMNFNELMNKYNPEINE